MIYNYEAEKSKEIPDLQTFLSDLATDTLMTVFFQHRSEIEIDMLRLPLIMAPAMTNKMVNNEASKKTIMDKEFTYEKKTLESLVALVDAKEVNLKSVGDYSHKELKEIATKLEITHPSKSNEMLKTDIVNLSKILLGKLSNNISLKLII